MKNITKESVSAFLEGQSFSQSNTTVVIRGQVSYLLLFGNRIAEIDREKKQLHISNCGWKTNTTRERLNALPNVSIQQKKGLWYLNGEEWDGSLKMIKY